MHTLSHVLRTQEEHCARIISAIADSARYINAAIRMRDTIKDGNDNASGDTQSALDITADTIFVDALRATECVRTIASEERTDYITVPTARADYCVAFDPYDGGSVGDANITFGSIIGIWDRMPTDVAVGTHLRAAVTVLYGPRVTLTVTIDGSAPQLFELDEVGTFLFVRTLPPLAATAQHFAPGNLRACTKNTAYKTFVDDCIAHGYKLRYSGALVTDINHILLKGDGVFTYPADAEHPDGRLRLFYEGAPLAALLEASGGAALTTDGARLLDTPLRTIHQRAPFFFGSRDTARAAATAASNG